MIRDGYFEEPRFFEPYNPLRGDYIPEMYNSLNESRIEVFVRVF